MIDKLIIGIDKGTNGCLLTADKLCFAVVVVFTYIFLLVQLAHTCR